MDYTIQNYTLLKASTLKLDDRILFEINGQRLPYTVSATYLNYSGRNNDAIFQALGIWDAPNFCTDLYGYAAASGHWPESALYDMEALTRVVVALFELTLSPSKKPKEIEVVITEIGQEDAYYFYDRNTIIGQRMVLANIRSLRNISYWEDHYFAGSFHTIEEIPLKNGTIYPPGYLIVFTHVKFTTDLSKESYLTLPRNVINKILRKEDAV